MFCLCNPPYTIGKCPDSAFKLSYTIQGNPTDYSALYIGTFPTFEAAIAHIKKLLKQEGDKRYNFYKEHGFKGTREEFDQFCCYELSCEKVEELCHPGDGEKCRRQIELYNHWKNPDPSQPT